ncbi:MAG: hypothetical protein K6T61_16060 [Bryobacteraceae bacterium]|nr:hypothetical protein [Bryobacteraceae bacterium]
MTPAWNPQASFHSQVTDLFWSHVAGSSATTSLLTGAPESFGEHKESPPPGLPAPGGTIIQGPGEINIPNGSVIFVTDETATGDAWALWWDAPSGTPIHEEITNWGELAGHINNYADGSITAIFLSGHGAANGGVQSDEPGGDMDASTLDQATADLIRQKLAPGGYVVILGCDQGTRPGMQDLANEIGVPVIGNTGTVDSGTNGHGDWVRFNPQP